MILKDLELAWIIGPFIIGALVYSKIVRVKTGDPLRDAISGLQVAVVLSGAMIVLMWFLLPMTPSLSTFGYPETVQDIDTQEKVLKLLQKYNKAIVRTTDAVRWVFFIMAFWFMAAMYQFLKLLKEKTDRDIYNRINEKDK